MLKKDIEAKCTALERYWAPRNAAMKKWYKTIRLVDVLKQPDMESFITNDPRTFYNMSLHLLDPVGIPHRIPTEGLDPAQVTATSILERLINTGWQKLGAKYRRSGRNHPMTEIVQLLLCTGWYSVCAYATEDDLYAEVWNPAEVYPNWTDDGLVDCAHIYQVTAEVANRKCEVNQWKMPQRGHLGDNIKVKDFWSIGKDGKVYNAVIIGTVIAKTWTPTDFSFIPVFVSPIGGLPDKGALTTTDDWKKEVGQSIVATNQQVYENYNKQLTFLQQLMRDVATPRWLEKSAGDEPILKLENMFKRGAIFRAGHGDEVGPIPTPPIPIEISTALLNIQGMMQRGSIPWQLYGNLQETVTAYLLTQVSSAARKILKAYHDGVIDVLTDIDNLWLDQILEHNYQPWGFQIPQNLPTEHYITAAYSIDIPGDLVLRATVARMVSPDFEISATTAMDLLFPEIEDPQAELNRAIADKAMKHPVAVTVELANAYQEQARRLRDGGQEEYAALYDMAYQAVMTGLGQMAMSPEEAPTRGAGGSPMPQAGLPHLGSTGGS